MIFIFTLLFFSGLSQQMLETVIPRAEPGVVMILSGKNKGMVSRNSFQSLIKRGFFFGKVFLSSSFILCNLYGVERTP